MFYMLPVIMLTAASASLGAAHMMMNAQRGRRGGFSPPDDYTGMGAPTPEEIVEIVRRIKVNATLREIDERYGVTEPELTYPEVLQEVVERGMVNPIAFPAHTTYDGKPRTHYELTPSGYSLIRRETSVWPLG